MSSSKWHRAWQKKFPLECREITLINRKDEKRRVDVLVGNTVIEFQHSPLSQEEFKDRNDFYIGMGYRVVWLFDMREQYQEGKLFYKRSDEKKGDLWYFKNRKETFFNFYSHREKVKVFIQNDGYGDLAKEKQEGRYYFEMREMLLEIHGFLFGEEVSILQVDWIKDGNFYSKERYDEREWLSLFDMNQKPKERVIVEEALGKTLWELWEENADCEEICCENLENENRVRINENSFSKPYKCRGRIKPKGKKEFYSNKEEIYHHYKPIWELVWKR